MKIRSGFVSNSSSSSFILTYDKKGVIDSASKIVEYLKNTKDNSRLYFRGRELNEGEDIFELEDEDARLIRLFSEQFEDINEGTESRTDYSSPEEYTEINVPKVRLYTKAVLSVDPAGFEYYNYDKYNNIVDMSDVEHLKHDISLAVLINGPTDEDRQKNPHIEEDIKEQKEYERIFEKRITEYRQQRVKNVKNEDTLYLVKNGSNVNDIVSEFVDIDNEALGDCSASWEDFSERYLEDPTIDPEDYNPDYYKAAHKYILKGDNYKLNKSYIVVYDELLEDKNKIMEYLKDNLDKDNYLVWTNPALNVKKEVVETILYNVGEEEYEALEKLNFKNCKKKAYLYTNAVILYNVEGTISKAGSYMLGEGKIACVPKGGDLKDFRKYMKEESTL